MILNNNKNNEQEQNEQFLLPLKPFRPLAEEENETKYILLFLYIYSL